MLRRDTEPMDSILLQQLAVTRSKLQAAILNDQSARKHDFATSLKHLESMLSGAMASKQLSRSAMQHIVNELTNMRAFTVRTASIASCYSSIREAASQECNNILTPANDTHSGPTSLVFSPENAADERACDLENDRIYRPWRLWFLRNLHAPYPDKFAKTQLLAQVPRTSDQLNTWFTNMRRRSGWTEVFRIYAQSSERVMRKLISDISSPSSHWTVSTEAKGAVARVQEYLQNSCEGSVDARLRQKNKIAKQHQATLSFSGRQGRSLSDGSWSTGSTSSLSNGGSPPPPPPPPYAPQPSAYDSFYGSSPPTPSYSSSGSSANSRHSKIASSMPSRPPSSTSFSSFGSLQQTMQQPSSQSPLQPTAQQPSFQPYSQKSSFQPAFNNFSGSAGMSSGEYPNSSAGKATFMASPAAFSRPPSRSARRPSFSGF